MSHPLIQTALEADEIVVHWFEQSTYAIRDHAGTVVLIDPYFPRIRPAEKFIYERAPHDESSLPVDYVLLTHNHRDHTWPESLSRLHESFPGIHYFAPVESVDNICANTSIPMAQITTIGAGDVLELGSMVAHAVYAKPPEGDSIHKIDPPDVTHLGYVVVAGDRRLYFSGDLIHTAAGLASIVTPVARLQPEIGFLTCHPTEGEFPFFDGCAEFATALNLRHAVPAHYRCFVKRDYDPNEWALTVARTGVEPIIIPRNERIVYGPPRP